MKQTLEWFHVNDMSEDNNFVTVHFSHYLEDQNDL
jgi:hypothetical protein